jgi:putative zinc finger/helix-turn-helix YgiT family protein
MDTCADCRAELVEGLAETRIVVGDQEFKNMLPGLVCPECGESYVDYPVMKEFELQVAQQVALNGPVTGAAFRFMRKALGMPSGQLAELFGVNPATVSRWEKGRKNVNPHVVVLLGSLLLERTGNETTTEERLRRLLAA